MLTMKTEHSVNRRFALNKFAPSDAIYRSDTIKHSYVATGLGYDAAILAFERELGRLDPAVTRRLVERKTAWSEVEREIEAIGGSHDLMIIERADLGKIASLSGREKRCLLYLV